MHLLCADELSWLTTVNIGEIASVTQFSHAQTNQVFLITTQSAQKYIFKRLNSQARTEQDRQSEQRVQRLAAAQQLSPKLLAECQQYRLQEYIEGTSLSFSIVDKNSIELLAMQLIRIHHLPALHAPKQRLVHELQSLKQRCQQCVELSEFNYFIKLAMQLDKGCACDTLCHGDLSFNNLLQAESKQIKILDWEYAVVACPAYDLAACSTINQLSRAQHSQLIESYYSLNQRLFTSSLTEFKNEIALYLELFAYLNQLWVSCFLIKD